MTDKKIALRELLEKGSDSTLLREMIGFAARRLMELETEALCAAGHGERSESRTRVEMGVVIALRDGGFRPAPLQLARSSRHGLAKSITPYPC